MDPPRARNTKKKGGAASATADRSSRGRSDSPQGLFPKGKRQARRSEALGKQLATTAAAAVDGGGSKTRARNKKARARAGSGEPLEAGTWTTYLDDASGSEYYSNDLTGRTTWTPKQGARSGGRTGGSDSGELAVIAEEEAGGTDKDHLSNGDTASAAAAAANTWTKHLDKTSRREYFCNTETGRSTWTDHGTAKIQSGTQAALPGAWIQRKEANTGKTIWVNAATGVKTYSYPTEIDGAVIYSSETDPGTGPGTEPDARGELQSFDAIHWNRNPDFDIQGPSPDTGDLRSYGSEGSAAHSLNEGFVPYGGAWGRRCARCCCCCYPVYWPCCGSARVFGSKKREAQHWRVMWPCWSHHLWVRAAGVVLAVVATAVFLTWVVALGELARFGLCVVTDNQAEECFQIQSIHVDDLCGHGGLGSPQDVYDIDGKWNIPVSVRVTLQNPGVRSWLGVGPVASEVHVVQDLEAEKDGVAYRNSFLRVGSVIEKHAFSPNDRQNGLAVAWNDTDVGTTSDGFAAASSDAATVAAASSGVAWIPGGNSTTLVELLIRMDETTGPEAAGHCVSSQMNDQPFAVSVTSVVPAYVYLWPFTLPLGVTLHNEFRCARFPQPDLADGTKVKDRFECGLKDEQRVAKAALPKHTPKPKMLSVGVLNTPHTRENMTITVDMALYLGLDEISVNAPAIDVDVRWGSQSSTLITAAETSAMNANATAMPPVVHVRTSPAFIQHGEVIMTVNVTVGTNGDDHTSPQNADVEGGPWNAALVEPASKYQLSRLQTFVKQFLKGLNTDVLIRGPLPSSSNPRIDPAATFDVGDQHFTCFARETLASMASDIKISLEDEDMKENEGKCPSPNATEVISFHELFFEGVNSVSASVHSQPTDRTLH
jgi:hypothetical protein